MLLQTALMIHDEELQNRAERALRLMRNNLQTLQQRRDEELEKINKDIQLKVTEEIKSLNLVHIV